MAVDKVVEVSKENNPADDVGGIVTTVKTESTSDLDVVRILKEREQEYADSPEGKAAAEKKIADDKAAEELAAKEKEKAKTKKKPEDDEEDDEDDDEPVDFKSLSPAQQKAITKVYKDRRLDKKKLRELETKMDELTAAATKPAGDKSGDPAPAVTQLVKPVKPKVTDYPNEKAFDEAMEQYDEDKYKYRRAVERQEELVRAQEEADRVTVKRFNDAVVKFTETHPDYDEVMDSEVPTSNLMFGAIVDEGPALGYYFAKHPKEAAEIAVMPNKQAIKAITRIIVKLEDGESAPNAKEKEKETPPKTKKSEPPAPLGGAGPVAEKDRSQMTFKEREREYAKKHPGALNYEP